VFGGTVPLLKELDALLEKWPANQKQEFLTRIEEGGVRQMVYSELKEIVDGAKAHLEQMKGK
jgi:hypothetical protein